MTEEEAKTQQCIGPRNCGRVVVTGSLNPDNFPRYCIGSACKMAWRWDHPPGDYTLSGHCGLAGKPCA